MVLLTNYNVYSKYKCFFNIQEISNILIIVFVTFMNYISNILQ